MGKPFLCKGPQTWEPPTTPTQTLTTLAKPQGLLTNLCLKLDPSFFFLPLLPSVWIPNCRPLRQSNKGDNYSSPILQLHNDLLTSIIYFFSFPSFIKHSQHFHALMQDHHLLCVNCLSEALSLLHVYHSKNLYL